MKTKNYSDFLNQACAYVGVDYADLQPDEVALLNSFFNKQINHVWNLYHWVDVCPYGEFRVPNNIIGRSKNLLDTSWAYVGCSATAGADKNPVSNAEDAFFVQMDENTSNHGFYRSVNPSMSEVYTYSVFLKPSGIQYVAIGPTTGVGTVIFDIVNAVVTNGTISATILDFSVNQIGGGWVQCQVVFSLAHTLTPLSGFSVYACQSGTVRTAWLPVPIPGGVSGFYVYYPSIAPTNLSGTSLQLIPWEQEGEEEIDVVFEVWRTSPLSSAMPKRCPYKVTPNGIQTYNTASTGIPYYYILSPNQAASSITITPPAPVYLYYRTRCPSFSGATYTTTAGYAAGTTLYYTYADMVTTNYVKTIVATNPGDTPENAPAKFKVLLVPQFAFDFVVQGVLADWLMTERQFAKAQVVRMGAQEMMDREVDRQERQMGVQFPFKVHTHFTSRANPTR